MTLKEYGMFDEATVISVLSIVVLCVVLAAGIWATRRR